MEGVGGWLRDLVARGRVVARIAERVLGLLWLRGVGWIGIGEGKGAVLGWVMVLWCTRICFAVRIIIRV